MHISLTKKLALLILGTLVCVTVPSRFIANSYVSNELQQANMENFTNVLQQAKEDIFTGFLNLNQGKIYGVLRAKEKLRDAARQFARLMDTGKISSLPARELLEKLRLDYQREYSEQGILLDAFTLQSIILTPQTYLGLSADMQDFKGNALNKIIANLPSKGAYSIYRQPGRGYMLLYFLPHRNVTVVAAMSIQDLEREAEVATQALIHTLDKRFNTLSLRQGGFIALFDNQGKRLASYGPLGDKEQIALTPLLEKARAAPLETTMSVFHDDGAEMEYLAAMDFSRPFQWFTVVAAPLDEINASTQTLLGKLALLNLGIGVVALCCTLLLLQRVVRPLRLLQEKSRALPNMDFSSPETGTALTQGLPLTRQDELGDLARSFAAMGEQLHTNIRSLMESAAQRERIQGELGAALAIQRGILPSPELSPNIFGLSSAVMLEPAREVGGDLYYFFILPDGRYAFVIGDASGKGVPAALFMSITVTLACYTLEAENSPGAALDKINASLEAHNPQTMFVTLFLALYNPVSGHLDYANAGHNPPLLVRGSTVTPLDGISGPMLGVFPGVEYQSFHSDLQEGDLCLLYTDGVTEAVNEAGDLYGEKRLEYYLRSHSKEHPKALLAGIFEDVKSFRGQTEPFDDITMLAFAKR